MTGLLFRHREVIFRLFTGTGATTSVGNERIPEPERGYIFLGWEPELPETMPEGELTVHALWEQGESQYTVLRWMEHAEDEEYSLLGDQEETAKIAVRTAAAGIAVLLLLAVRKKKRLALK